MSRPSCGSGATPTARPLHAQPWPAFDPALVAEEAVTMVVQVNGKVRDRLEVDPGISEADAVPWPWPRPGSSRPWPAREPRRVVVRPPRLVNVVV